MKVLYKTMFALIKFPAREPTTLKNNSDGMEKVGAEYGTYNFLVAAVPYNVVLSRIVVTVPFILAPIISPISLDERCYSNEASFPRNDPHVSVSKSQGG